MRPHRLLTAALILLSCSGREPTRAGLPPTTGPVTQEKTLNLENADEDLDGLRFRLTEVERPYEAGDRAPLADARPLSASRVDELLGRLPPIDAAERTEFKLRKGSPPPPRTGTDIQQPWPPPPAPDLAPDAASKPVEVLRFAPEGDVPLAPHVSITFNQPMVALTSHDRASRTVPVRLDPPIEGKWRWVGTTTLLFEADPRLPMATAFTATVPAGTRSASGQVLDREVKWTFQTPPPKIASAWPVGPSQPLTPVLVWAFDQKVDARMASAVQLRIGKQIVPVRDATADEIAADEAASARVKAAQQGRFVAKVAVEPLQAGTNYELVVPSGAPSAEGPRTTTVEQVQRFRTFDPLTVRRWDCWMTDGRCNPAGQLSIHFNNALADDQDLADLVTVQPKVADLRLSSWGSTLVVSGRFAPQSSVTVTLDARLTDRFGQQLARAQSHTYRIGDHDPSLMGPGRDQVVLDPMGPAAVSVYTRTIDSLNVAIYAFEPEDLAKLSTWASERGADDKAPPLKRIEQRTIKVTPGDPADLVETAIDLSGHLGHGRSQVFVLVEPTKQPRDAWRRSQLRLWVQRTALGVTAHVEPGAIHAWITDLTTGAPVPGAQVSLLGAGQGAATSNDDGVARLGSYADGAGPHALVVKKGDDTAMLPATEGWWMRHGPWGGRAPISALRWFVFDDRGMVKPGETAYVKGFVRPFDARPLGGLQPLDGPVDVQWEARDSRGASIGSGRAKAGVNGSFDLKIEIPDTPNLGPASVTLTTSWDGRSQQAHHSFQIQEFRRPEFEVKATVDPRPYTLGEHAIFSAEAAYYAGGGLPAAPARWQVTATPASYRPPGWDRFSFGQWSPWWRGFGGGSPSSKSEQLEGKTGPDGSHAVRVDFLAARPTRPYQVRAEVSVEDVNRQRWSASTSVLVHPSDRYVGLKLARPFIELGKEQEIEAVVVDLDGEAAAGVPIAVRIARLVWKREKGAWREVEEAAETCERTSALAAVTCAYTPAEGGSYRAIATVVDDAGRANETVAQFWVSGGRARPNRIVEREELLLVPSAETFAVGETAEIFVQAPFAPAEILVAIQQYGVVRTERRTLADGTGAIRVPIEGGFVPQVTVSVEAVGAAPRVDDDGKPKADAPKRVAFAGGEIVLKVPPRTRTLQVAVTPERAEHAPGASTYVDVDVRDAGGAAVRDAEVVVWMVDESVLALSGYQLPDPLSAFYAAAYGGVASHHSRAMVQLVDPAALTAPSTEGAAPSGALGATGYGRGGGGMADDGEAPVRMARAKSTGAPAPPPAAMPMAARAEFAADEAPADPGAGPISVRTDFRALAFFEPSLRTDAAGRIRVPVNLPDSLTRYRVFAVAADPAVSFGSGEANVVARKPLMLRPSPPRFLNVGDRAEVPFVVQNPSDRDIVVDLALRVDNGTLLDTVDVALKGAPARDRGGLRFTVPAEDRREVRLPVGVVDAGTLRWQAVIVGASTSDAASDQLPVWTPATTEAFATYGTLAGGATAVPIEAPKDAWPQYGGLEVSLSSTELHSLTDAVLYLNNYPFDCTEQIASRVLSNAALRDVLQAFSSPQLPPPAELEASVREDLERLQRRQLPSGGFLYWSNVPDYPYASLHAAHALVRARDKGWAPPGRTLDRALSYAKAIERHIPAWYSTRARYTIRAYALYVRHRAGDSDRAEARKIFAIGLDELPLEAQGWILPVLAQTGEDDSVQAILRHWNNRVTETAAGAQFAETYGDTNDYVLMHGSRRTDAVLLEALLEVQPDHDLNVKVVRALLGHRKAGRWSTTQENSFVLLALDRYFRAYEGVTPNFVARIWIDGGFVGEAPFRGRTTERHHVDVPMAWLVDKDKRELVLGTEGEGRLYYRLGLRYAPADLQLPPAEHGFSIERRYEPIDDPADVSQSADGTWNIKAGARVRVRVTAVVPARRTMVALMDPLPAGLEPMNPSLAITGTVPADPNAQQTQRYWWWSRPWFSHQNLRDERAEAFGDLVWPGVHEYVYVATATTPGRYVVPPPRIEEMYHPETFGRGASARVVIR